jgi:hypothetical protein
MLKLFDKLIFTFPKFDIKIGASCPASNDGQRWKLTPKRVDFCISKI